MSVGTYLVSESHLRIGGPLLFNWLCNSANRIIKLRGSDQFRQGNCYHVVFLVLLFLLISESFVVGVNVLGPAVFVLGRLDVQS